MATIFRVQDIRFVWRATVLAHRIDQPKLCKVCNGTGKTHPMMSYPDDDLTCPECFGRGKEQWCEPLCEQEIIDFLQKKLDEYIVENGYPGLRLINDYQI